LQEIWNWTKENLTAREKKIFFLAADINRNAACQLQRSVTQNIIANYMGIG
jgi:endo-1,4-beta-D-glucanase Y